MPEVPPTDGFPDIERDMAIVIEKQRAQALLLTESQRSTTLRFRETLDQRTELLTDKCHARRLLDRHGRLNRALVIAKAILALQEKEPSAKSTARKKFDAIRTTVEHNGAFLIEYDLPLMTNRLASTRYVIAESRSGDLEFGGDCQVELPADDGALVVRLPDPSKGDICFAEDIVRNIANGSMSAALLADICADDEVAHQRYAGHARYKAFEHIVDTNATRLKPIKYIAAEIFSIRGIQTPTGEIILLDDFGESPLGNSVSVWIHNHSKHQGYAATTGWVLKNRNVAIMIDDQLYELIADWWVMIHDVEKIARHRQKLHPDA